MKLTILICVAFSADQISLKNEADHHKIPHATLRFVSNPDTIAWLHPHTAT